MSERHPKNGIITALPKEFVAMKVVLEDPEPYDEPGAGAGRRYLLGRIPASSRAPHEVVLCMCEMGNNSASARATLLLEHFKKIEVIIMTGIAGGVPNHEVPAIHVRLGDIVVSGWQGVVQYDMKDLEKVTCNPRPPAAKLREAVRFLEVAALEGNYPWENLISPVLKACKWKKPAQKSDFLYSPDNPDQEIPHPKDKDRRGVKPRVFSGTIASSNELLRDPKKRDELAKKHSVRAVEMETSGVADTTWNHGVGYFGIRGICDYCDPNKGYKWQEYAAAVAAAYTHALLESMPGEPEGNQNGVIFKVEFRLDQELFNFDQNEFVAAVEQRLGIDMQNVKVSVRSGSVIVTLKGNSEVLSALVRRIENSRLFEALAEQTDLESVTWLGDGIEETRLSPFVQSSPLTDLSQIASERGGADLPAKVSIGHLPQPGRHFVGREDELALLDKAWDDTDTNIVEFVAFGGVGKSALTAHWLRAMSRDGWRGAARVFGHSFYSQGSREDAQASADSFINEALQFFGDPDPKAGSPWDKGERLARLVREQQTLLILDGMEPLQYPARSGDAGQIRDPGLRALVRELANGNNGLVIISTRTQVQDLKGWEDASVRRVDLEHLSPEAGAQLFKELGVGGTDEERQTAAQQVKGHGLALTLLGTYLKRAYGGDIRRIHEVELFQADNRAGGHALHMMERYERFLGEGPELTILRLRGLFDRPATQDEIDALRAEPAIPGLTDELVGLGDAGWNFARANLCDHGLLDPTADETTLDAHPLIREYFAEQLEGTKASEDSSFILPPSSFREAHRRLYEHLKQSVREELPDNLNDMMPLYHAVAHGCKAGLYKETYDLYIERILQDPRFYSTYTLGAFGLELSTMSSFHGMKPAKATRVLSKPCGARIMRQTGYCLRPLARMPESLEWVESSLAIHKESENWGEAKTDAGLMSGICESLGELERAVDYALETKELALKLGEEMHILDAFALCGQAFCQVGRLPEAGEAFSHCYKRLTACDNSKHDRISNYITLLALFRLAEFYNDSKLPGIREHTESLLGSMAESDHNYGLAVANLTIAICLLKEEQAEHRSDEANLRIQDFLVKTIYLLRKAGRVDVLPRAWLLQSALHRDMKKFDLSWEDIRQAIEIAEPHKMLSRQCDCHLEYIRLKLRDKRPYAQRLPKSAQLSIREHFDKVDSLVRKTKYRRWKREIENLRKQNDADPSADSGTT